ncbi:MAG: right-handed parallel beta-helix repeat-containing protein [Verrucomicrobiales bacterium]|nr:right-handed parallel beta-helix repeat-containing protein [Verrucomicrobiales bacterium]
MKSLMILSLPRSSHRLTYQELLCRRQRVVLVRGEGPRCGKDSSNKFAAGVQSAKSRRNFLFCGRRCIYQITLIAMLGGFVGASDAAQGRSLTLSLSTNKISEAEGVQRIQVRVGVDSPSAFARTILIGSPNGTRLVVPETVKLPEGGTEASFAVETINDGDVNGTTTNLLRVAIDGLGTVFETIEVIDDDSFDGRGNRGTIGGRLSGVLPAGDYEVTRSIEILSGVKWSIGRSAHLRFHPGTGVTNWGTIVALGTPSEPIQLSAVSNGIVGRWNGITDRSSGQEQSFWEYLEISQAVNGLQIVPSGDRSAVVLNNCKVHDCSDHGIHVWANPGIIIEAGAVQISSNHVYGNGDAGISVGGYSLHNAAAFNSTWIFSNEVWRNGGDGIRLSADTVETGGWIPTRRGMVSAVLGNNSIHGNGRFGIWATADRGTYRGTFTVGRVAGAISNNRIFNNGQGGIQLVGNQGEMFVRVVNNTVVGNSGAGISHDWEATNRFELLNNIVVDNRQGIEARGALTSAAGIRVVCNDVWRNNRDWVNYPVGFGALTGTNHSGLAADWMMNISLDPCFSSDEDFRILPWSKLVDLGTTNGAPVMDYDGQVRSKFPDIGSDEASAWLGSPKEVLTEGVILPVITPPGYIWDVEASSNMVDWSVITSLGGNSATNITLQLPKASISEFWFFRGVMKRLDGSFGFVGSR